MSNVPAAADAPPPLSPALLELLEHPPVHEIPRPRQIFVNRNTRMSEIEVVGFDMDYTVGTYRMRRIEELSYAMTLERLIAAVGYPREIASLTYDHAFVMRGLVVDKDYGNLFKSDRFNHVGRCYHGRKPLDPKVWRKLYRDTKFRVAAPRFAWIDTLFALPEAALYAQIIELLESRGETVDYAKLYEDIRHSIDEVHRDGTLKARIRARIEDFVAPDLELGAALHKLRSSGKKLFLLTNSLLDYTEAVMSHVLDGRLPEYPSWRNYFDVIVVGAQKPRFFSERAPFFEVAGETDGGETSSEPAEVLERGKVYEGGNLVDFERLLKISGDRVLYVGDHIYGDILRSKKSSLWRTCMIVEELETELAYTEAHAAEIQALASRELLRARLDDALNQRKLQLNLLDKRIARGDTTADQERREQKLELEKLRKAAKELNAEIEALAETVENGFNPNWGLLFKEGNENSRFGEQIEDYACLYTSRVSNFLAYSPMQYFRAPRAAMAHERAHAKLAPLGDDHL